MRHSNERVHILRCRLASLEDEIGRLKAELSALEPAAVRDREGPRTAEKATGEGTLFDNTARSQQLPLEDYTRYGRQMILPDVGLEGQRKLKEASVLIVGLGGLGCPAAMYLAAAGVGTLGLMDGDAVELSNLHRQVAHNTDTLGMKKVDSVLLYLQKLNPRVRYVLHHDLLDTARAPDIFSMYHIILDCTDNPASRYLISDTAVLLNKRLVSASALGTEGQLMVLNDPPRPAGNIDGGPCYRCIFPEPPPAATVVSCDEGGVLGPVVGMLGVYQALETIRLIVPLPKVPAVPVGHRSSPLAKQPTMMLFSACHAQPFRTLRLRSRRPRCAACSIHATVTLDSIRTSTSQYLQLCGTRHPIDTLEGHQRISVEQYRDIREAGRKHVLVDVRETTHYGISNFSGSVNIPYSDIQSGKSVREGAQDDDMAKSPTTTTTTTTTESSTSPIYVICRLGNDSQLAVAKMIAAGWDRSGTREIKDVRGGFSAWKDLVDQDWPFL